MKYLKIFSVLISFTCLYGCNNNEYTITFQNYDGSVLQTSKVKKNEIPIYNKEVPTKPSDSSNNYCFTSWSPELAPAVEDKTYIAQYEERAIGGCIYSLNEGGGSYYVSSYQLDYTSKDYIVLSSYKNLPVTSIGDYAFSNCSSISSIYIPNSIKSCGFYSFSNCSSLSNVNFEDNSTLELIENYSFSNCKALKSITLPNSVISINPYTFEDATSLSSITFAANSKLNNIASHAFSNCTSLSSIKIPSSVTSIENEAFYKCTSLSSIEVDTDNKIYDSRDNSNAIIKTSDNSLILGCKNTVIPNTVTVINEKAFKDSLLSTISIPKSVISISDNSFEDCTSLSQVTFEEDSLLNEIGEEVFSNCTSLSSITLPSNLTSIGSYAFYNCKLLTSISIPSKVTSIGSDAFSYCIGLSNFTFDTPSNLVSIESYTLSNCSLLSSIIIPNSVSFIDSYAFYNCQGLLSIDLSNLDHLIIGRPNMFLRCNLSSGSIKIPSSLLETYKNALYWSEYSSYMVGV